MERETYRKMRELEDAHWWFVARRRIIATMIRQLGLPASARLLEVGCGTGGNLEMLGRFGELVGVEHDPAAAELARDRSAAPVLIGSLPGALPPFDAPFDLVLALDVIEHVERDAAALKALAGTLKPGGRLLVTVPAFPFLWSQHDVENEHYRRYRKSDMRRLAQATGLQLDYLSYFNSWLFPPVAAVRLLRKVIPYRETWQDMRTPSPTTNGLLQRLFASERHWVGRLSMPFGVSLLAIFTRRRK